MDIKKNKTTPYYLPLIGMGLYILTGCEKIYRADIWDKKMPGDKTVDYKSASEGTTLMSLPGR